MTEAEEKAYEQGRRAALVSVVRNALRELGYQDAASTPAGKASWIIEREEAIAQLRTLCEEYGDNEWSNDLHLGDVIEKHLARHLAD